MMSSSNSYESFSETKLDFKISWKLFKENWKAFLSTLLFSGLCLLLISAVMFIFAHFIPNFLAPDIFRGLVPFSSRVGAFLSSFFIILIGVLVFFAFLGCQYGLSFDIMSSGDQFAEFKGSFTYFRRHSLAYSLLTILISWGVFTIAQRGPFFSPESAIPFPLFGMSPSFGPPRPEMGIIQFVMFVLYFFWFLIFINTLPSITAQGHNKDNVGLSGIKKFKNSFVESFRIFKKCPKRLLMTWGLFFLIFIIPLNVLILIANLLNNPFGPTIILEILKRTIQALWITFILIGTPVMALLATRIYNSVEFERIESEERDTKTSKK